MSKSYNTHLGSINFVAINDLTFSFIADSDDVFVTQKMWEGEYYFDKNKIPKTWQNIFSYHFVKPPELDLLER